MNRYAIIVGWALLTNVVSAQDPSEGTIQFLGSSPAQRITLNETLSAREKDAIVIELKGMLATPGWGKPALTESLAFLGDEAALQQLVREFLENDATGPGVLGTMQNPRIIELVAPSFFGEEPWRYGGDVFLIPRSYRAAELTVELLASSPAFNAEVINWARGIKGLTTTELRALIRPWWKENEKFFREKNYKAVQPGPERPRDPLAYLKSGVEAPPSSSSPTATPALPIFTPTPLASAPVASATETSVPSAGLLWTIAVAAVALLAGLLFFWKRRA